MTRIEYAWSIYERKAEITFQEFKEIVVNNMCPTTWIQGLNIPHLCGLECSKCWNKDY